MDIEKDERLNRPSASEMDALHRCHGRWNLCQTVPKRKGGKSADRGTLIHSVLEGATPFDELTPSDQSTAQCCMNEEDRYVDLLNYEGAEVHKELRLWMVNDDFEPLYSGKMDSIHLFRGERALVVDAKTGFSFTVPIEANFQIKCQAVLVYTHFNVKKIEAILNHPNHPESISEKITFNESQLQAMKIELDDLMVKVYDPLAKRTPNKTSCTWCSAKNVCPEYLTGLGQLVPVDSELPKPKYELFKPQELAHWLELADMAIQYIEDGKEFAKALLKTNPAAIPGYALKQSNNRVIKDEEKAKDCVIAKYGKYALEKCSKLNLKKLEDFIVFNHGIVKGDVKEHIVRLLGDAMVLKGKEASLKKL